MTPEHARVMARYNRWMNEKLFAVAEELTGPLRFLRRGTPTELPLWHAVAHVFNHQTHHRGQVTTLLSQAGRDPGVTDLVAMLRL